ncbi:MAG: PilZ domain-containing protein, partial [Erythrobacter sp.]|nr:PilZ domain-containing protein [Erythrobacter sp.]
MGIIKRGPRFDVAYDCSMIDGHGRESQVRVTDISRHGCKIVSETPLKIGERVVIRITSQGER